MKWTDDQILARLRDAEKTTERGSELVAGPGLWPAEGRTDSANARRFVLRFLPLIRWCDAWGKWLIWDGRRWVIDQTCQIDALAKKYAHSLWSDIGKIIASGQTDETLRKALNAFGKSSNSAAGISNLLRLARSEPGVGITPEQLDTDRFLLNCENGTIDLRTGVLREHCREDFISRLVPVKFDSGAECPLFTAFLQGIFGGKQSLIEFLQRLIGYCVSGSVSEQVLPIFYGTGANGKSTLLNVLLILFADYAGKAAPQLLTAKKFDSHPTEVADLYGRRLVIATETEEGCSFAEAKVKELTGSDKLSARRMYENFWNFDPTHKIVIATNHRPTVRGDDYAIWRRLLSVPFDVTIPKDKQDRLLPEKLCTELAGILRWAVSGCLEWQRIGLSIPNEVSAATSEYKQGEDALGGFIDECCEVQADATESAATLLDAYKDYSGDAAMNQKRFARLLTTRGYRSRRISSGQYRGRMEWVGLQCAKESEA